MSIDSSSKAALHKGYKHWCPEVEPREDWDKDFNFVLIRSIEELKKLDVEHKFVAWDTETSGLNPDIDWLVGFSFSFDGKTGYYVPVKHDDIALGKEALDIFFSILSKAGTQFLYNCRFDQRFFEAAGWKKVVDEPPAPEDGCTVEVSGWTEGEDALTKVYKQVAMPAPQGGGQGGDTPPAPAPRFGSCACGLVRDVA